MMHFQERLVEVQKPLTSGTRSASTNYTLGTCFLADKDENVYGMVTASIFSSGAELNKISWILVAIVMAQLL
jgi:hypothetical protein